MGGKGGISLRGAKKKSQFVEKVNNFFDTINSTRDYHPYPYKCAYGTNLDLQRQALLDFKNLVQNMQVMNKANEGSAKIKFQPWQKGVLLVCSGFTLMYEYLAEKYQITSFKTYRVCQDTVEQTFSTLRALGGNNPNMDPVDFIYRLERFCIGGGKGITVDKANILFDNGAQTLTISRNNADLVEEEPVPEKVSESL